MRRGERGATTVEYALIVGLIIITLLGAIQVFEDRAEDRFDDRSAQGDPTEEFGNLGPSGGTGGGSTDGSTDGSPGGTVTSVVVSPPSATAVKSGNEWSMTVTIIVTGDGQPLSGFTFSAPTWNPSSGGTSTCTTTADGICTFTQDDMDAKGGGVAEATFTMGSASFTNPDGSSPTIAFSGSGTITCQKPSGGQATSCP